MPKILNKSKALFIFRKPYLSGNYSVEFLFNEVISHLEKKIDCGKFTSSFYSQGILARILIAIEVFFKRGQVNIITGDISFANLFLPKKSSILVILDCGFLYEKKGFYRSIESLFWFKLPFNRASKVVAISDATKHDLLKITKGDPSKIEVIPCFINPIFKESRKDFCKSNPVLLQVGQAENKNLRRIIYALKDLSASLSIIGNISKENIKLLMDFNINFTCASNLSDEEVFQKYKEADILLFPSTYEGFGLPIIEAQTVGRPVITSNITSMPWVAGKGACLVDPYSIHSIREGILDVINNDSYRNNIIEEGFKNIKRFEVKRVISLYENLLLKHFKSLDIPKESI